MSGHSKWSTIKRQKGAADIKRGQTFTKIANAITIAVKMGGSGDPDSNPRLRVAMDAAKAVNMPRENVNRAIDRGLGRLPGQTVEEVIYEGFGPGKVAFLIEAVTDNKLRTLQEIKNFFERHGGSLGGQGSVAYMFERKGEIRIKSQASRVKSKDDEMLELIDLGAEEVEDYLEPFDAVYPERSRGTQGKDIQKYLVYTEAINVTKVSNKISQAGYGVEAQELVYKPNILTPISDAETAKKVLDFATEVEDLDDMQKVYANFDIPEELVNSF